MSSSNQHRVSSRLFNAYGFGNHDDSNVDEHNYYKPDAWKVALEATHEKPAPSPEIKIAAQRLVFAEFMQQATGWLVLTQMGVLLGSFGQLMPLSLCLLSLFIFMLEAMLKFMRNWAHRSFFMDVPCAYVPLHEASYNALANFEMSLKLVLPVELILFASYIYFVIHHLVKVDMCETDNSQYCEQGSDTVVWILLLSALTVLSHSFTSVLAWWRFNVAMGNNKLGPYLSAPYRSEDKQSRLLCLTWWVHLARHQHLSAVVANKEPMNCNLPGHWFETVDQLTEKLRNCVDMVGEYVIASEGPLWDSLTMTLTAILCLANRGEKMEREKFLNEKGFDLLVRVVREGKFSSCRGLAAAAIAIFARKPEAQMPGMMELGTAVIPLKRLARSKENELREVALGALLNIVLNDYHYSTVVTQFDRKDGIVGEPAKAFMQILMDCAYSGSTPRCQELAMGILARVAGRSEYARSSLLKEGQIGQEIAKLVELMEHGLSVEIKASAAGVLAELAAVEFLAIAKFANVQNCTNSLFKALEEEPRLAYPSARALSNLAQSKRVKESICGDVIKRATALLNQEPWEPTQTFSAQAENSSIHRMESVSALTQEQVQAEAARILWVLSYRNPEGQERITEAGVIPRLATLLESEQPKVYTHAISAFTGIAWENKTNQDIIAQHGRIVPRMVVILKEKDMVREEKGVQKVILALIGIVKKHRRNRDVALQAGIEDILGSIKGKVEIYKDKALPRLESLWIALTEDLNECTHVSTSQISRLSL